MLVDIQTHVYVHEDESLAKSIPLFKTCLVTQSERQTKYTWKKYIIKHMIEIFMMMEAYLCQDTFSTLWRGLPMPSSQSLLTQQGKSPEW